MVRLLRQRMAYEANLFGDNNFLLSPEVFPFYYALSGPESQAGYAQGSKRQPLALAQDAFTAIQRDGPISKRRLVEVVGGAPSGAALDRALGELWSRLRITRVDYSPRKAPPGRALPLVSGVGAGGNQALGRRSPFCPDLEVSRLRGRR